MVRLVVKGFREWENRWDTPLVGSVVFRGVTPDAGTQLLSAPERPAKLVEFLGDSITEGVLVLNTGPRETWSRERWPEFSDGRRSWAYQSALWQGAEPRTVGFGRLGLSINANGGVPPALHSFPFMYSGAPIDKTRLPDAVVINMGTNDGQRVSGEVFRPTLPGLPGDDPQDLSIGADSLSAPVQWRSLHRDRRRGPRATGFEDSIRGHDGLD